MTKYWYRPRYYEDREYGDIWAIERVDKQTGATMRLGRGDEGLSEVTLSEDYIYWGVYGHSNEGGVRRVSKQGGLQQDIEIGKGKPDVVRHLTAYRGRGMLVTGWSTAAWIPEGQTRGAEVYQARLAVGAATYDGRDFYITEQGRIYGSLGAIYRVSNGVAVRLVGSLAEPSAIAVHGDSVYFMLDATPDVWSVPTAGGTARKVVVGVPYDPEHGEQSLRLWAHDCGLIWLHGNSAAGYAWRSGWPSRGIGNTLRYLPWSALE